MNSNRLIKVVAIICAFCLVVGGGFLLLGYAYGGSFVDSSNIAVKFGLFQVNNKRYDGPFDNKTITIDSAKELTLDLSMIEVLIDKGDEFSIRLVNVPQDTLKVSQENDHVRIYSDYKPIVDYGNLNSKAYITIPETVILEKTTIDFSMGKLDIVYLNSDEVKIESSMTSIKANNLDSRMLTIDSSMADVVLKGTMEGKTEISNSMGNVELTIYGNQDEYGFEIDNSMGSIEFAGKKLDGWNNDMNSSSNANHFVDVSNSMGNVEVKFKDR